MSEKGMVSRPIAQDSKVKVDDHPLHISETSNLCKTKEKWRYLAVVRKAMSEMDKLVDSQEFARLTSGPLMYAMKRKFKNQQEAEFFLELKVADMKEWIRNNK